MDGEYHFAFPLKDGIILRATNGHRYETIEFLHIWQTLLLQHPQQEQLTFVQFTLICETLSFLSHMPAGIDPLIPVCRMSNSTAFVHHESKNYQ
jgi:hypothetical protein